MPKMLLKVWEQPSGTVCHMLSSVQEKPEECRRWLGVLTLYVLLNTLQAYLTSAISDFLALLAVSEETKIPAASEMPQLGRSVWAQGFVDDPE